MEYAYQCKKYVNQHAYSSPKTYQWNMSINTLSYNGICLYVIFKTAGANSLRKPIKYKLSIRKKSGGKVYG